MRMTSLGTLISIGGTTMNLSIELQKLIGSQFPTLSGTKREWTWNGPGMEGEWIGDGQRTSGGGLGGGQGATAPWQSRGGGKTMFPPNLWAEQGSFLSS